MCCPQKLTVYKGQAIGEDYGVAVTRIEVLIPTTTGRNLEDRMLSETSLPRKNK